VNSVHFGVLVGITMTDPMLVMYEEEIKASLELFNQPKGKVEFWKRAEPGS